jgi:cysteinyl-tRNA synthetase
VNVDNEKMAKSLGNFFTIRQVLDSGEIRHPEVLRYFLISSQYRGPINYSLDQLQQAEAALGRLYTALRDIDAPPVADPSMIGASVDTSVDTSVGTSVGPAADTPAWQRFHAAMDDDFNTPEAIAVLQSLAGEINRHRVAGELPEATARARELRAMGAVLGILQLSTQAWFQASASTDEASGWTPARIEAAIAERKAARAAKNFARSDQIRDELAVAGIVLEDKPGGETLWRRS